MFTSELATWIQAITSIGTFVLWAVYSHLFLKNWKQQREHRLIIGRFNGFEDRDILYFTNLSQRVIYVDRLQLLIRSGEDQSIDEKIEVTDLNYRHTKEGGSEAQEIHHFTNQGPLKPGQIRVLAPLKELLSEKMRDKLSQDSKIELRVLSLYEGVDKPIGSSRHFQCEVDENNKISLSSYDLETKTTYFKSSKTEALEWI